MKKRFYACNIAVFLLCSTSLSFAEETESSQDTQGSEDAMILGYTLDEVNAKLDAALNNPEGFREKIKKECEKFGSSLLTTAETIQLGSRIFNAGAHLTTFRLYEGATYKLMYNLEGKCPELEVVLRGSLLRAYNEEAFGSKAWRLREGLDLIMGGQAAKPPGAH